MTDRIRVLFVDDNEEYVDLAMAYFDREIEQMTLVGETDVDEVIARITDDELGARIDVIVSDYQMPRTDGLELLDIVREAHPDLPFILLTGQGDENLASTAIHRGVSEYLPKGTGTDQFRVLANRIENLVGRTRAEESLQTREAHLEALTTAFPDLAFLLDGEGRYLEYFAGEPAEELLATDPKEIIGRSLGEVLPGSVAEEICGTIRRTLETERLHTVEYQLAVPAGPRWFEARVAPVDTENGDAGRVVLVARDITERRHREQVIEQLHEATRDLMQAQTEAAVADRAVSAADRILDFTGIAIFLFEGETSTLRPAAYVEELEQHLDGLPTFERGDSIAWEVFVSGEAAYVPDVRDHEKVYDPDTPIRSEVLVPLGDHGVLIAGSTSTDAFGETDIELLHLLASNTESALDRTEREEQLLERERTLTDRNEELRTVNHLNTVLRDIGRTVTTATTRAEIQQTVCDRLIDVDPYSAAWLGEVDTAVEDPTPVAWAGLDAAFFDRDGGPTDESAPERRLCSAAVETRSAHVARNVLDLPEWEQRRRSALTHDYRSVAAIPILDDGYVFSVLVLYAKRPDAFSERETSVLAEGGNVIGHAIHELDKVRALVTDNTLELEIGIDDSRWFPCQLSEVIGCRVEIDGMLPQSDGTAIVFVTARGVDPDHLDGSVRGLTSISDVTVVAAEDDELLLNVVVALPKLIDILHTFGASVLSSTALDGESTVTVGLPPKTEVRSLLEAIEAEYSDADLRSRHERMDPLRSRGTLKAELVDRLTERQLEVMQVAYYGGFFDPVRKSTGEQLAGMLDISGPTFHKHLRAAQRKLLAVALDR